MNSNTIVTYGPNTCDYSPPTDLERWVPYPHVYPPIDVLPVIPMKPREGKIDKNPVWSRTLTERVFALENEIAQLKRELEALRVVVGHDTIPCPGPDDD